MSSRRLSCCLWGHRQRGNTNITKIKKANIKNSNSFLKQVQFSYRNSDNTLLHILY
jgi:hypothetical protein